MIKLKDKPFLVKLLDAFCDQQYYYLVMEWCGTDTSTTLQTIITARNVSLLVFVHVAFIFFVAQNAIRKRYFGWIAHYSSTFYCA